MRYWLAKHLSGLILLFYVMSSVALTLVCGGCAAAEEHAHHAPGSAFPPCPLFADKAGTCHGRCLDGQLHLLSQTPPHRAALSGPLPPTAAEPPRNLATWGAPPREPVRDYHEPWALGPLLAQRHLGTVVLIV